MEYCPASGMLNGDEASSSIILDGQALLVKMLMDRMVYWFKFCILNFIIVTGMQKGDKASLSIILAGHALLVKMLITLEPHGAFDYIFFTYVF